MFQVAIELFRVRVLAFIPKFAWILAIYVGITILSQAILYYYLQNTLLQGLYAVVSDKPMDVASPEDLISKTVKVDVSGAVSKPGLYELSSGSRVGEALEHAGGITANSDPLWLYKELNLSKLLKDEDKIYIPFNWDFTQKTVSSSKRILTTTSEVVTPDSESEDAMESPNEYDKSTENTDLINVNNSSASELDSLPGIGPVNAQKIIDNRPYIDISDFTSRSGLNQSTLEKINNLISV